MNRVLVVIPAYNEAENIERVVDEADHALSGAGLSDNQLMVPRTRLRKYAEAEDIIFWICR